MALKCPLCVSRRLWRSHRRNRWERLISVVGIYPFRCEDCHYRFRAFSWKAGWRGQRQ
jgi:hypothetical protein